MSRFLVLSRNDFKMIFRDPMLKALIFAPAMVVLIAIFLVPLINERFPTSEAYNYIILMGAGVQAATMFGFITGFIFLEENKLLFAFSPFFLSSDADDGKKSEGGR